MTTGRKLVIGFIVLWIAALVIGVSGRAHAGAAPVVTPLPAAPSLGWCYNGPVPNAANDVSIRIGDCPAPPPTSCAVGRMTVGNIRYPTISSTATRYNVDLTRFENIYGHATVSDTAVLFPGRSGAGPAVSGWNVAGSYIAAEFTPTDPSKYNQLRFATYSQVAAGTNLRLDISVSSRCGDFAPATPHCAKSNIGPGGDLIKIAIAPYANGCRLTPGVRYYLNIRPSDGRGISGFVATNNTIGNQP